MMMRTMGNTASLVVKYAALLAAALVLSFALAAPAYAKIHLNAPTTVSDDITRLHISKLDADTHAYVAGAKMAIVNEETGEVVDEWVTATGVHENEKGLDVGVVYVLRELEAPEGYGTVQDVRFVVNETEGTGITVLSQGNDSELTASYKLNLYDKALGAAGETVVTQTRGVPAGGGPSRAVAPKTGDGTPLGAVGALVGLGVLAIILLQIPKRKME